VVSLARGATAVGRDFRHRPDEIGELVGVRVGTQLGCLDPGMYRSSTDTSPGTGSCLTDQEQLRHCEQQVWPLESPERLMIVLVVEGSI